MDQLTLQFSTTSWAGSGAIRIATRSDFSHVDVVIPPGIAGLENLTPKPYGLLGAAEPGGVQIRPPDYQRFIHKRQLTLVTDKAGAIIKALATQIGKPFDHDALKRVFDPNFRDWEDNGKWYCAELVMWGLLEGDYFAHRSYPVNISIGHVTPEDILGVLAGDYDPAQFVKDIP